MAKAPIKPQEPLRPGLEASIAFDIKTDGLCFGNFADSFEWGNFPLREYANKTGACQGMAGLVRAFKTRANFRCGGTRPNRDQVLTKVRRLKRLQLSGCNKYDFYENFDGFCSARELCEAHKDIFQGEAIDLNATIAISYISRDLRYLFEGKSADAQSRNVETLWRIFGELKRGNAPLLHYPWHVVLVTGLEVQWDGERGAPRVVLTLYNPNFPDQVDTQIVRIAQDFVHTEDELPIFPLVPESSVELRSCSRL